MKMKSSILLITIIMCLVILVAGCTPPNPCASPVPTHTPEVTKVVAEEVTPGTSFEKVSTEKLDNISYTADEIEAAKTVAKDYYSENTNYKIDSLEYDTSFVEEKKIKFIVTVKDSKNPPRTIVLGREDENSEWVADKGSEGY